MLFLNKSPSNRWFRNRMSQLAKSSWCQRECWHHLPMWRISLLCRSVIVIDVKK